MKFTKEQNEIILSDFPLLSVDAGAGTGKTSTLLGYASLRKRSRILYVVYNAANKTLATARFPSYVDVETAHSLALKHVKNRFRNLGSNLDIEDILSVFQDFSPTLALEVVSLLNGFFFSTYRSIEEMNHLDHVKEAAINIWEMILSGKIPAPHDAYLKFFQLQSPVLDYDYILFDESQDANPAILDIILSQNHANRILVGDDNQKIYGFRGAMAAKGLLPSDVDNLTLSQSFRFGPEIAGAANKIIKELKGVAPFLRGTDEISSSLEEVTEIRGHTRIFRTNAHLFDKAVSFIQEGKQIHIIGGIDPLEKELQDILFLYYGEYDKISNSYLKTFKNFSTFKGFIKETRIPRYLFALGVFEKYGESLGDFLSLLRRNHVGEKNADIILTTAHKSKGLEFLYVCLEEDFAEIYDENGHLTDSIPEEEINVMYVAVTRAIERLQLNRDLQKLIKEQK